MGEHTKEKNTIGFRFDDVEGGVKATPAMVVVRVTSDQVGESLSLQAGSTMIQIALEPVLDTLDAARRTMRKKGKKK